MRLVHMFKRYILPALDAAVCVTRQMPFIQSFENIQTALATLHLLPMFSPQMIAECTIKIPPATLAPPVTGTFMPVPAMGYDAIFVFVTNVNAAFLTPTKILIVFEHFCLLA